MNKLKYIKERAIFESESIFNDSNLIIYLADIDYVLNHMKNLKTKHVEDRFAIDVYKEVLKEFKSHDKWDFFDDIINNTDDVLSDSNKGIYIVDSFFEKHYGNKQPIMQKIQDEQSSMSVSYLVSSNIIYLDADEDEKIYVDYYEFSGKGTLIYHAEDKRVGTEFAGIMFYK